MSEYILVLNFQGVSAMSVSRRFLEVDDRMAIDHASDWVKREKIIDVSVVGGSLFKDVNGILVEINKISI